MLHIPQHVIAFCDNQGVVDGWRTGKHRNSAINNVFKRIHDFIEHLHHTLSILTRWIPSTSNPADLPSHGIYNSTSQLLPPLPISDQLREYIIDAEQPLSAKELRLFREGTYSASATRTIDCIRAHQEAEVHLRIQAEAEKTLIFQALQDE